MALRVCPVPGCPALVRSGKCPDHRRQAEQARGTRQARGYDRPHELLRADYQRRMDAGETFICWRCAEKGTPHLVDPTCWDLGHDDETGLHRGPECPAGNRAVAGR